LLDIFQCEMSEVQLPWSFPLVVSIYECDCRMQFVHGLALLN
jgi:hypothetical protein